MKCGALAAYATGEQRTMFGKTLLNVARRSRKFLEGFLGRAGVVSKESKPVNVIRHEQYKESQFAKGYFRQRFAQYGIQNLASQLRRQFSKSPVYREYRGLASKLSVYAFVGIGVASCGNDDYDVGNICEDIKKRFTAKTFDGIEDPFQSLGDHALKDYHLGSMIAKGCNAAVYRAKRMVHDNQTNLYQSTVSEDVQRDTTDDNIHENVADTDSDIEVIEEEFPPALFHVDDDVKYQVPDEFIFVERDDQSDVEVLEEQELTDTGMLTLNISYQPPVLNDETSEKSAEHEVIHTPDMDLAIKIIFNYDIESNASELYKHLQKELLPAHTGNMDEPMALWHNGHRAKEKHLPGHPNIVAMYGGFVDDFPILPGALEHYPCALPQRVNPEGCGRNKTLFIVMKRYPYTLREYIQAKPDLSVRQSTLILLQLVEAVIHMAEHGVAHRDLKSDNIFVEEVEGCPHLVVSDFGECVCAENGQDLCVPYVTEETSKGGNDALRAPEIACARPGPSGVLDYRKADLWAVGALAYEIFGMNNPFYRLADGKRLRSTTYREVELPQIGGIPKILQKLIRNMLSRDPNQRLSPRQISACLHLLLWPPAELSVNVNSDARSQVISTPSEWDLIHWILLTTARVLLEQLTLENSMEHQMRVLFLSRLDFKELLESMQFLLY